MNDTAINWIATIMAALRAISPDVSSTDSKWIKPDDFYELKSDAGENLETTTNEWIRLDGRHWMSPRIKWIKKSEPSQHR